MSRKEYLNFVFSKIEKDLRLISGKENLRAAADIINMLKNTDDLIRAAYVVSAIRDLKKLGNYLLFIIKKVDEKKITFDNLLENLYEDREHIKNELVKQFNIETKCENYTPELQGSTRNTTFEKDIKQNIYRFPESQFVVENIENELVTEEFNETEILAEYDLSSGGKFLELVNGTGNSFNNGKEENILEISAKDNEGSNVFSFPKTGNNLITDAKEKEIIETEEKQEEREEKDTVSKHASGNNQESLFEKPPEQKEVTAIDYEDKKKEAIETEEKETINESNKGVETTENKTITTEEEGNDKIPEEIKETENVNETTIANDKYADYERELFISNDRILSDIEDYYQLSEEDTNKTLLEKIASKIIDTSSRMEERSSEMSFEIITLIYETIKTVFKHIKNAKPLKIKEKIAPCLTEGINVIGSLIRGDEEKEFGLILKNLNDIRTEITNIRNKDKTEPKETRKLNDVKITEERVNDTNKDKFSVLKQDILDIEKIFKSLDEIKGEFQAYEALRRLSTTFLKFKSIVRTSREMEMFKMAQLAEASYIFIKFLQNYRVNPFEEDVNEVFKYLVYSFKLLFLDKPAKDLDLFISYLNEPVKIFVNKK